MSYYLSATANLKQRKKELEISIRTLEETLKQLRDQERKQMNILTGKQSFSAISHIFTNIYFYFLFICCDTTA